MSLEGSIDASGNYTPPAGAQLSDISHDIGILQSDYAQDAQLLTPDSAAYTAAMQDTQNKLATLNSVLQNPDSTQAQITTAQNDLQTSLNAFNTAQTQYNSDLANYQQVALGVVNAQAAYQQLQASQLDTSMETALTELNGVVSHTLYSQLQASNATRVSADAALTVAINNFNSNEEALVRARTQLSQAQNTELILQAQATISDGLEPSPAPSSGPWATYEAQVTTVNSLQASVNSLLASRPTYENALNSAILSYKDSYYNATTGFETLLQQAATTANANVALYLQQISQGVSSVDSYMDTLLAQQQAQDALDQTQHYALYPTGDTSTGQTGQTSITDAINATLTAGTGGLFSLNLSLPSLPASGQDISMSDLMRFISVAESAGDQLQIQTEQADFAIDTMRARMWLLLLNQVNQEMSIRLAALTNIVNADLAYNNQVNSDNSTALAAATNNGSTYNSEVTDINYRISLINAQNAALTANDQQMADSLNTAAQQSVNSINSANYTEQDTITTLNLLNQDTPPVAPTPLPDPTPVTISAYPQFPPVSPLPDPPPNQSSSPADISTYNADLRAINEELAPISSQLDSVESPPLGFQSFPPLFYRMNIPVRTLQSLFPFAAVQTSLASLYTLINNAQSAATAVNDTAANPANNLALLTLLSIGKHQFGGPISAQSTTSSTTGTGISLASSETDVSVGKLVQALNELLASQVFASGIKNVIERSLLLAALQTGIQQPGASSNRSSFGVLNESDFLSEISSKGSLETVTSPADAEATNTQLEAVANQLISQSTNVALLQQNANIAIASSNTTTNLSPDALIALNSSLVLSQQVLLLLLAGIALGSIGANANPDQVAANLISLVTPTTAPSTGTTAGAIPVVPATTTPVSAAGRGRASRVRPAVPRTSTPATRTGTASRATPAVPGTVPSTTTPVPAAGRGTASGATPAAPSTVPSIVPSTATPITATGTATRITPAVPSTTTPVPTTGTGTSTRTPTTVAGTGTPTETTPSTPVTPVNQAGLVAALSAAGLTTTVSTQLATLLQTALTLPSTTPTAPLGSEATNALIIALQNAGFTIPSGTSANSPDLLATILNAAEIQTDGVKREILRQQIAEQLIAEELPAVSINVFNSALQAGTPLGDAFQDALNSAQTTQALSQVFQTSTPLGTIASTTLGTAASIELAELLQATINPSVFTALGGSAALNTIALNLSQAGFNIPTNVNPNSPEFISQLFNAAQSIVAPENSAALTAQVAGILTRLNLSLASIQNFTTAVASGISLGRALNASFAAVPGDLINNLNVNLNALPPDVLQNLENQIGTTLAAIPNLTIDQKTALAIALGVGVITPNQATSITSAFAALQLNGATPRTIALFISAFQPPKSPVLRSGDPNDTRSPSTMPTDLVQLYKDTFANLATNKDDLHYLENIVATFADTVVTQSDFYKFSIEFLLDPAKSFLRNFSILTAQTGSGGLPQTPNQIPV